MNVKISNGNAKMGAIPSVSLPAGVTCRSDCECSKKCYAKRLERMRPSVRQAYKHNYDLLNSDPNTYWREVEASIMMSRFFRFHVSGDIPDATYFEHMVDIARTNTHCEILCFISRIRANISFKSASFATGAGRFRNSSARTIHNVANNADSGSGPILSKIWRARISTIRPSSIKRAS